MPRFARAVMTGSPHHLVQRGVNRQQVFYSDADCAVYLELVKQNAERFGSALLGYCLMPNHVHWVVVPKHPDSLARTFGEAHGRYACYANARKSRSGHFWQNRFFSCMLDRSHFFTALRYVERNPVRAGLVKCADEFRWSSAKTHIGESMTEWLEMEPWIGGFTHDQWGLYLKADTFSEAEQQVRASTYTGRPAGSLEFVKAAESMLGRTLSPKKGGRPQKQIAAGA